MALTATSNSKSTAPSFNLPAELQNSRLAVGLTRKELARQLGCKPSDIRLIEAGKGRAEIMIRAMNQLRVDLTGIAAGTLLHDRLRATRERRTWSIDKLAEKTGLTSMAITRLERGMGEVSDLLLVLRTLAPNFNRRGGSGGNGGDKDSRFTDEATVNALKLAFGDITFDPCAHSKSPVKPKGGCYFELGHDGLAEPWVGEFVFMNPPFTKLAAWTTCALLQWRAGQIGILACLIPTRTDSLFFKEALLAGASAFFFGGRLKFVKPDGTVEASKITTMLVVFGSTACQRATFAAHQKGVWVATSEGENGKPAQRGAKSSAVSVCASAPSTTLGAARPTRTTF